MAPWIFTVGASTTDRNLVNYVSLGNKKQIEVLCILFFSQCIKIFKGLISVCI